MLLQFEAGYKPRGWLGLIIGSRPYFSFSSPSSIKEIMGQLVDRLKKIRNSDSASMHRHLPKLFDCLPINDDIDIDKFLQTCWMFLDMLVKLSRCLGNVMLHSDWYVRDQCCANRGIQVSHLP